MLSCGYVRQVYFPIVGLAGIIADWSGGSISFRQVFAPATGALVGPASSHLDWHGGLTGPSLREWPGFRDDRYSLVWSREQSVYRRNSR